MGCAVLYSLERYEARQDELTAEVEAPKVRRTCDDCHLFFSGTENESVCNPCRYPWNYRMEGRRRVLITTKREMK